MDKASVIGVLLGVAVCGFVAYRVSGGQYEIFYSEKGLLMVLGGTISVIFMAMPMSRLRAVPGYIKRFMFHKDRSPALVVQLLATLGEKARRDGILALEPEIESVEQVDSFLATGLRMAVDGAEPEVIESTLRLEIMAMQERHKAGRKFFEIIKLYAPGYGLVATLIAQIGIFGNLGSDIGTIGHMLAVAIIATLYGALIANGIAGPIGDKLAIRSAEEIMNREMMLQGILSIQSGDNPRITLERMKAFIPLSNREKLRMAA